MSKNIIFQISGGLGKCVAATAVCKAIKNKYPKDNLIVISSYPQVFLNNPNIYRNLQFNSISYFFEDYIKDKDVVLMVHEPYLEIDYLQDKKHLIHVWCEMNNIPYNYELPEIFLTERETEFLQNKYRTDQPIMVMQTNGGFDKNKKYSFARDLPISVVNEVINTFKNDYKIIHVRREDQIAYQNTIPFLAGFRDVIAITLLSQKRLLIDSFLQHATAALNLKSTVCWITSTPNNLGYSIHDNILANPFTKKPELRHSIYSAFDISGIPEQFPYNNDTEIFNVDDIIKSLKD